MDVIPVLLWVCFQTPLSLAIILLGHRELIHVEPKFHRKVKQNSGDHN